MHDYIFYVQAYIHNTSANFCPYLGWYQGSYFGKNDAYHQHLAHVLLVSVVLSVHRSLHLCSCQL